MDAVALESNLNFIALQCTAIVLSRSTLCLNYVIYLIVASHVFVWSCNVVMCVFVRDLWNCSALSVDFRTAFLVGMYVSLIGFYYFRNRYILYMFTRNIHNFKVISLFIDFAIYWFCWFVWNFGCQSYLQLHLWMN